MRASLLVVASALQAAGEQCVVQIVGGNGDSCVETAYKSTQDKTSTCEADCKADAQCIWFSFVLDCKGPADVCLHKYHKCNFYNTQTCQQDATDTTCKQIIARCKAAPPPAPTPAPEVLSEAKFQNLINAAANANVNVGHWTSPPTRDFSSVSQNGGGPTCFPWQPCWAQRTPAPPITDAPNSASPTAFGVSGDPFTTYNGRKTQFWTTPGAPLKLMQCGTWQLHASVFDAGEHQWFKDMQISHHQTSMANFSVAARKEASGVRMQTAEWEITEVGQMKMLHGGGSSAELRGVVPPPRYEVRAAASVNDQYPGFQTITVLCEEEGQRSLGFEVSSAPANKMEDDKDALRYAHLDLNFLPTFNATTWCSGVLPEIWGLQPLSESTAKMLVPPKGKNAKAEESADE